MSEKEFHDICSLDYIADEAGGFVDSSFPGCADSPHYDYRSILTYCKERNIEPIDLTIREMQQFVISQ